MALIFTRGHAGGVSKNTPEWQDDWHRKAFVYLKKFLGHADAQAIWEAGESIPDTTERAAFYTHAILHVEQLLHGGDTSGLQMYLTYKSPPVDIKTFICDPYYLNKEAEIYPGVLEAAIELNNGSYVEAVLTGGIGSGKTTLALYTTAYQLYILSRMRNPHRVFGLDPSSEIMFIFQSITKVLAKGVDYQRFRNMIEGSRYFVEQFAFDKGLESKLVFPNRIEVVPVAGNETAAIGQNVMGGVIDELNYMAVIEKSRASVDKGTYDQAVLVYNSIARRRKSRFMENGKLPGILCLVSSKKYPGQFTDQKMEEAKSDPTIFVYDKRVWDIKPHDFAHQGWFYVFVGDLTRKPRILADQEVVPDPDRHLVVAVPKEFRVDFEKDVINALREIAGVSTLARHPFFLEVDKVAKSFHKEQRSVFEQTVVDFIDTKLTLVKSAIVSPELPRFVHIDLALSGDSAGLAIGTVSGFKSLSDDPEQPTYMPTVRMDGVLEIRPPKNGEILFSKIRDIISILMKMGMNIRWVTFDQFQSNDSMQILRQWGLITGLQSMDTVPCRPYEFTKSAMYDGRLDLPAHPHLQKEILMVEKDTKTGKVDHVPGGSKDCADAMAGVVFGLTMRRELWGIYRIPIASIPAGVMSYADKLKAPDSQVPQQELDPEANHTEHVRKRLSA